jgi:hypothetical protein
MITCAVHRYGFLVRTLPHDVCLPYLATTNRVVRHDVFQILGASYGVQTLDQLDCAKRELCLPADFGKRNVPSLELDAEPYHYVSFTTTLANMITYYEFESLGPMYGLIRHEILHVATSTVTWAVQLRSSYDMTSNMGAAIRSRGVD